ncbi:chemotaxis protein CheW [Vogesella sp. LIG4]|uniref:chemotaxis protein CheW n=1 Tax=Vogesella sp. LIG4 TaxID=1192162 RepID=UPI00082011E0|nr:chemotaxis protein CheW [Vogesella sp. LIG4]SCK29365.1 purine-binding chemotaxis protein CheW [Vogesella sp. LIG4]
MSVTIAPEQYLTFTLGRDIYALQIAPIREIIEYPGLTEIPMTPEFLRGVINLRGAVVPVIDLAVRFGRGLTKVGRRTCIVITEIAGDNGPLPLGILVDGVNEVLEVGAEQIEDKPDFGLGLRPDFVSGMIRHHNDFIVMLDIGHVLSVHELEKLVEGDTAPLESVAAG